MRPSIMPAKRPGNQPVWLAIAMAERGLVERDPARASCGRGLYGGQIPRFAQENPKVPVMLHFGKQDDHIPATEVAKVQAAHPEVEIYWYDAGHAFNSDMRRSYNEKAAKEAMVRTLEFFKRICDGSAAGNPKWRRRESPDLSD